MSRRTIEEVAQEYAERDVLGVVLDWDDESVTGRGWLGNDWLAGLSERFPGTLMGFGVLYVINFIRILTLLTVGLLYRSWFEATHLYAWQAVFLLVVGTCWIAWVSRLRPAA